MYVVVLLGLLSVVSADVKYVTTYDNIDIDAILQNQRLSKSYFNCLMDRGKCSPEGATLKGYLAEAIATDCEKCSEKQKETIPKILNYLYNKKKDVYRELQAKYDPERKYHGKYLPKADD